MKVLFLFIFMTGFLAAQPEKEIKLNLEESIKIALENIEDLSFPEVFFCNKLLKIL